jgi:hypothetical protein
MSNPNPTIKASGLSYVGDECDGQISVYRLQLEGIHLMDVLVDNKTEVTAEEAGVTAPDDATLHPIAVATPDRKVTLATKGVGVKVAHIDGDGVSAPHIDGITVAQYVLPRAMRFMGLLLQDRMAL